MFYSCGFFFFLSGFFFITSSAAAAATYCDKHVCLSVSVCVCLSASLSVCLSVRQDISRTTCAIFAIFVHAAYGRGSVFLWHDDEITRRGSFGVFFIIDNAL